MKFFAILFLVFFLAVNCSAQENRIKFTDGTELTMDAGDYEKRAAVYKNAEFTGRFAEKETDAALESVGKAVPLPLFGRFLNVSDAADFKTFTRRQNKSFFNKFDKITTAYDFMQNGGAFYLSGLESIDLWKLDGCRDCRVKVKIIILEMKSGGATYFVPIAEALTIIEEKRK